jgi:cell wall assembly regulator SMI1
MLGNLSVDQIEKRLGIQFPEDVREFMKSSHQANAQKIQKGKWHCFDIPFQLVCGDMETASKIYNSVKHKAADIKEPLHFGVQQP